MSPRTPLRLSLSVRIVEAACKSRLNLPLEDLVAVARETGYTAVCMRASAGGIGTPPERLEAIRRCVEQAGLFVSMVTADVDVPRNNEQGPRSLRDIRPSLDVAQALGCDLIRVCLKRPEDVAHARAAADLAAERGIRLAHQCHTSSLFEQVDAMLDVLKRIDRQNFGLIYEPANLLLCGESYGRDTLRRLAPHLMNVYVQNHRLEAAGPESLETFCRGEVRFHHLDPWTPGGIDFGEVVADLRAIGYGGTFTIHPAQGIATAEAARAFALRCSEYFQSLTASSPN